MFPPQGLVVAVFSRQSRGALCLTLHSTLMITQPAPPPDWQRPMLKIAEGDGDFLPLGDKHYAFFAEERPSFW